MMVSVDYEYVGSWHRCIRRIGSIENLSCLVRDRTIGTLWYDRSAIVHINNCAALENKL